MNSTDKKLLIASSIVGLIASTYVHKNENAKFLGLDHNNSKKLVYALTAISAGLLVFNVLKPVNA